MAKFEPALAYTLKHEGGWSDDPADPGGATNYGITLKTAAKYGITTKEELRAITPETVAAIYRAGYWPNHFNDISEQSIATKIFDMGVNMGLVTAIQLAQRALNDAGADGCGTSARDADGCGTSARDVALTIDGRLGSVTLAALNNREPALLMKLLCAVSADHYQKIAAKRPASQKYLKGWLKRANGRPHA